MRNSLTGLRVLIALVVLAIVGEVLNIKGTFDQGLFTALKIYVSIDAALFVFALLGGINPLLRKLYFRYAY